MSNRPQFIPTVCPPPPSGSGGSPPDDCPPPEETQNYVIDIRNDLHSGDPEMQEDGFRRLCIEALEQGRLDFYGTGEIDRVRRELGFAGGLAEMALCLVFPDLWPPEPIPSEIVERVEDIH